MVRVSLLTKSRQLLAAVSVNRANHVTTRHARGHKPCNHATRAWRLRMTSLGTPQGPSVTDIGIYIQRKMRTCCTIILQSSLTLAIIFFCLSTTFKMCHDQDVWKCIVQEVKRPHPLFNVEEIRFKFVC